MKNGSTWKVISCAAVLLFGLLTFILGGWRTDMANAASDRRAISAVVNDGNKSVELQGNRITALETRYETIDKALDRIEGMLKER